MDVDDWQGAVLLPRRQVAADPQHGCLLQAPSEGQQSDIKLALCHATQGASFELNFR